MLITRQQIIDIFNAIKTAVEGAIPAGGNAIGSVDVDNFPATQTVDGTVGVNALPALPAGTNNIGVVTKRGSDADAYESVTVAAAAIGFTAGTYGTNTRALITCETAQVRYRVDGTNPTAAEGHILNPSDVVTLTSLADITAFRAIRTGATSGVLKVTFSGVA